MKVERQRVEPAATGDLLVASRESDALTITIHHYFSYRHALLSKLAIFVLLFCHIFIRVAEYTQAIYSQYHGQ